MKPLGPIPPGFTARNGELVIGGKIVSALVKEAGGTPLFVYSRDLLDARMAALRAAMPQRLKIHYAMKANPFAALLEHMADLVDGLDIASGGELDMARKAGFLPGEISFAGPGKTDRELLAAVRAGVTLNIESAAEARRALDGGQTLGVAPRLAIRVNPDFELRGSGMKMGGGAKPFGVDQADVPALGREIVAAGARWRGLHIYTGSQALDAAAVIEMQGNVLAVAAELADAIGAGLPHLNMGGGFGIPYFDKDQPLDIAAVGAALAERFDTLPDGLQATEFAIELGRYLVGEAGVYLTRIIERKVSHGTTFLITDGGMHHQLAASGNFGTVVRRNYPVAIAGRFDAEPTDEVNVVGCLCTPLDRLADNALLPRADAGDLVAVFCAGAYGASASPSAFLGQGPAREILV
ncbi:pyridoxal-dependent decarboxylase, exosortase A system-associated [Altererythrobacter sp. KTW20L]|uniref:pyridoxal-dependent decarboxylase, exosortase A system-associated n=1 Tax=Altererythrobacter sp. KTW20L TaxID=2942210 RepID=UPI0020BD73CA|nr:pyridoxal-dependent decarboxylase, exosortase A system-associated [Altererythrobacter sp. KTW20L]MCL6251870.1 pyridoxal-dependent decarboxylase, exosortase A system-associated [Altererythrobacter sp. KTW20L]